MSLASHSSEVYERQLKRALAKSFWNDCPDMDEVKERLRLYVAPTVEDELGRLVEYVNNCPPDHVTPCQKAIAYLTSTTINAV